jgi:hypothetical protein
VWDILVMLAALALAGLVVMWVRSHRVSDLVGYGWRFTGSDGAYRIRFASARSVDGALHFGAGYMLPVFLSSGTLREGWFVEQRAQSEAVVRSQPVWSGAGFEYQRIEMTGALAIRSLGVPYWFLCACAAATVFALWRRRRRGARRRHERACATCGYDLRESRERCPECGTAIPEEGGSDNTRVPAKDGVRQS